MLNKPIFIIGAARSGTTMLGDLLAEHPDVAYWVEPKYIWRFGNPGAKTDVREAEEATPQVVGYIRQRFERFVGENGGRRFMEKTPSNCFRIPFVHAVFPDGLFVHLLRDGRDVAVSAREKWSNPPARDALFRRATSFEVPLREAPFYARDFLRDVLGRTFRPQEAFIWGPHFPGIREVRSRHTVLETCAIQWRESVAAVAEGLEAVPPSQQMTLTFEDFVDDPEIWISRIFDFLELPPDDGVIETSRSVVRADFATKWKSHSRGEVGAIEPLIRDLLTELGY